MAEHEFRHVDLRKRTYVRQCGQVRI